MCIHAFNEKKLLPTVIASQNMIPVNTTAEEFLVAIQKELNNKAPKTPSK